MKYNYVLFISQSFVRIQYDELKKYDNIRITGNGILRDNNLLKKLHKIHWSYKINSKINLPMKNIWFNLMTNGKFDNDNPVCYVFFEGQYCRKNLNFVKYIKMQNPKNKIVCFFTDLIGKSYNDNDLKNLKQNVDLILSYDLCESKKYNIGYYGNQTYSRISEVTYPTEFKYDVYFVGYAKDRLKRLYEIYDYLTKNGVKCFFQLMGVPKSEQKNKKGLVYLEHQIPYSEIVNNIQKSKCILEVTQEGSRGHTLRTSEAICYARKLLSDRKCLLEDNLFSAEQVSVFSTVEEISIEFLNKPIVYSSCNVENPFSPEKFINYLEEKL